MPEAVVAALLRGARAFRQREYQGGRNIMSGLALGQSPKVMVIACADSRVDPGLICGAAPGELFVIRNVANLVPPYAQGDGRGDGVRAALEYGVKALGVSDVVILGHSGCGGVGAMIDMASGVDLPLDHVRRWVGVADRGRDLVLGNPGRAEIERRSVLNSIANLGEYPWVREQVHAGALALHGWWFNINDGRMWVADLDSGVFAPAQVAPGQGA